MAQEWASRGSTVFLVDCFAPGSIRFLSRVLAKRTPRECNADSFVRNAISRCWMLPRGTVSSLTLTGYNGIS